MPTEAEGASVSVSNYQTARAGRRAPRSVVPGLKADWLHEIVKDVLRRHRGSLPSEPRHFPLKEFLSQLGATIRAARVRARLTQAELAASLSQLLTTPVRQPFVARSEKSCSTTIDRFGAFGVALGVPPSVLITGAEAALLLGGRGRPVVKAALNDLLSQVADRLADREKLIPAAEREAVLPWLSPEGEAHRLLAQGVGDAVKLFRHRRGLSQADVASEVHESFGEPTSAASVAQLEGGHAPPSWVRLAALAWVLNVSLGDLAVESERAVAQALRPLPRQLQQLQELTDRLLAGAAPPQERQELIEKFASQKRALRRALNRLTKVPPAPEGAGSREQGRR